MNVDGEDSEKVEEVGEVDLPLIILPLFEPTMEPTSSDVVAGILG